jgi:hypothetical protein
MTDVSVFDWDSLDMPEFEDPAQIKVRLDAIHRKILEDKKIAPKPEKNSPGFRPTPYQAREVSVMACLGLDASDIALVLNIEERLLKTYYSRELKVSHNIANAMVARVALQMALSGRSPDMTKFWLKSRAKWKETHAVEFNDVSDKAELDSPKDRLKRMIASQPQLAAPTPMKTISEDDLDS